MKVVSSMVMVSGESEEADQGLDEGCPEEGRVLGVSLAGLRT